MKTLIVGDKPTVARLAERLKQASSHSEYQRIQCVLIRATMGTDCQVAGLVYCDGRGDLHGVSPSFSGVEGSLCTAYTFGKK